MMTVKINYASLIAQLYKTFLNYDHILQNQTLILQVECMFLCSSVFALNVSLHANFMFLNSALNEISSACWHFYFFVIKK